MLLPIVDTIQAEKLSVSLPMSLVQFIENYKVTHQYKSRSQVIQEALQLLQQRELEAAYRDASGEIDLIWDVALADGLTDETCSDYPTGSREGLQPQSLKNYTNRQD